MISPECVWEFSIADALVLVRPEVSNLYILNSTAAVAWKLFRSGYPIERAIDEFALLYGIPKSISARDVEYIWSEWQRTILAPVLAEPITASEFPLSLEPIDAFCREYHVHGKIIRVALHHPDLIAEIAPRLESLLAAPNSSPETTLQAVASKSGYHVISDDNCLSEADPALARIVFLQELVRLAQPGRKWAAILHAAACGTPEQCVIFPAASHSGKTTLAAALVHAGLTFYSDDSVALENDSLTIPAMPFAMMIREGSWPVLSQLFPDFQQAPIHNRYGENVRFFTPPVSSPDPCGKASAIVFSQWVPGANLQIEELDSFDALVRLKESGFWVAHEKETIAAFLDWLQSLPAYHMVYSDLAEAIAFVQQILNGAAL